MPKIIFELEVSEDFLKHSKSINGFPPKEITANGNFVYRQSAKRFGYNEAKSLTILIEFLDIKP